MLAIPNHKHQFPFHDKLWLSKFHPCMPRQYLYTIPLYRKDAVHPLFYLPRSTSFRMRSGVLCSNRPPAMPACFLVFGDSSCALRKMPLHINQITHVPLHFRATLQSILPDSFPNKPKSTLLSSRIFILLFVILTSFRVLNPVVSWPLQLRLPWSITSPASFSLFGSSKSSRMPLLVMYPTTYIKNLSPTHSKNLLNCSFPVL